MARRTVGSLTHADFGKVITVASYPPGVLWSIQHVAAHGDIAEPWTRVLYCRTYGNGNEGTKGLPPETPCTLESNPAGQLVAASSAESAGSRPTTDA